MATTSISGLASGIQWAETVDALMQLEAQPLRRYEERKDEYQRARGAWTSMSDKLKSLQSAGQSIDTLNEVLVNDATSSDNSIVTVSASSTALEGSHSIVINQLAQAQVYVHDVGWHDLNTTALQTGTSGTFAYNYDGTEYTVTVPAGTTLEGLINLINSDADNPGITASSIDDGGAAQPLHLVLGVNDPTSSDLLSISASTNIGEGVSFDGGADWTTSQSAQEAQFRIDGYPAGSWLTRTTNEVDDVIEGLTLNLKETTATPVTVTVQQDFSAIKSNIEDWVSAYNEVIKTISAYTAYDSENGIRGVLMGDSRVSTVRDSLVNMVTSQVPGLGDSATFSTLAEIGIDISNGLRLTVDETDLADALEQDSEAVANLFIKTKGSDTNYLSYFTSTSATQGGSYEVTATYDANGDLDASGTNTIGGYAAKVENDVYLVGKDDTPVEGLRIRFNDPGDGPNTLSGTVDFGTGFGVMSDNKVETWTDIFDGLITLVKEGYDSQIDSIDDQIAAFQRRLVTKREMLERQFLKMEEAVSKAQGQANWTAGL